MDEDRRETEGRPTPTDRWRERRREMVGAVIDAERVAAAIEAGEIERADATFALELARMSSSSDSKRGALFCGVLAASVARRQGSVRFDVSTGGVEGLAERLRELLPMVFAGEEEARTAAAHLRDLLGGGAGGELVGEAGAYRPLVVEEGHLYRHADRLEEERLADALAARIDPAWRGEQWPEAAPFSCDALESALRELVEKFEPAPTVEQQYAIVTAATSRLSVVTGGPGTGKTSLVVALLRLLAALGVDPDDVALAAPTGKAADRLASSIHAQLVDGEAAVGDSSGTSAIDARISERLGEPATIHRLLGYSRRRRDFSHDAYRPLPHEYVVVDEASMIDLELMDRLVAAVDETSRLVLVGDADQLPAVGSGAVFRDLVPETVQTATPRRDCLAGELAPSESEEPVAAQSVVLTENFRMREGDPEGSNVLAVAEAVRDGGDALRFTDPSAVGNEGEAAVARRGSLEEVAFRGAELVDVATGGGADWIEEWYDGPLSDAIFERTKWREPFEFESGRPTEAVVRRLDRIFEAFERVQLLGVTRRRPSGVVRLDRRLYRRHVQTREIPIPEHFAVGEPVMMTKNDYEREIFNGDRGVVLRVRDVGTGSLAKRAVFPRRGGYAAFALDPLRAQLDRAWSITVHKSQGSEYDTVGIVLPEESIPLVTCELLYTGITRARHAVTFFGDPELVREAARRSDDRNTGLVERLEERL